MPNSLELMLWAFIITNLFTEKNFLLKILVFLPLLAWTEQNVMKLFTAVIYKCLK